MKARINGKSFGDTRILGAMEFAVQPGETLAILGPSGIGKSTLLRLVSGIDANFDGHVERPDRLAMVFQEPTLLPWRSALRNITLVHPRLGETGAQAMLARVGLGDKASQYPGQLSLGQQRRLALARAFAGQPELLIMDEPFASLDPDTAEDMLRLTEELIAEHRPATIFVTHSKTEATRLANRVLRLGGTPAQLAQAN